MLGWKWWLYISCCPPSRLLLPGCDPVPSFHVVSKGQLHIRSMHAIFKLSLYMVTVKSNAPVEILLHICSKFKHCGVWSPCVVVTCVIRLSSWRQRTRKKRKCEEERESKNWKKGQKRRNRRIPSGWWEALTGKPKRIHSVWELSWLGY